MGTYFLIKKKKILIGEKYYTLGCREEQWLRTEVSGNVSLVILKVKIAVSMWSKSEVGRNVNYVCILKLF